MNITLLQQGFGSWSESSVGQQIIKFLTDKDFHTFTGITAFTSQAGIKNLSQHINNAKKHLDLITIISGVDQKGTSKEALEELLSLNINSFVFYEPSIAIFHPKIYLFEGLERSELIIGSSNLTYQGLFTNVETSFCVSIDNSIKEDKKLVEQLKNNFKGIFDFTHQNLQKLSKNIISDLVLSDIVPTEADRKTTHDKEQYKETENILSKIFSTNTNIINTNLNSMAKTTDEIQKIQIQTDIKESKKQEIEVTETTAMELTPLAKELKKDRDNGIANAIAKRPGLKYYMMQVNKDSVVTINRTVEFVDNGSKRKSIEVLHESGVIMYITTYPEVNQFIIDNNLDVNSKLFLGNFKKNNKGYLQPESIGLA